MDIVRLNMFNMAYIIPAKHLPVSDVIVRILAYRY